MACIGTYRCPHFPTLHAIIIAARTDSLDLDGKKKQISPLKPFLVIYGLGVLFFFANVFLAPGRGLSGMIKAKQDAFMSLHGNTRFELTPLNNQTGSYVKAFPQAFLNSFLQALPMGSFRHATMVHQRGGFVLLVDFNSLLL